MLASSSRRESCSRPENRQAKKVGCMSGIFYFLHIHRPHSRKRLSSGKRDTKPAISAPTAPKPAPPPEHKPQPSEKTRTPQKRDSTTPPPPSQSRRLSRDSPRSPTLPSEIRRSSSPGGGSPRTSPALVARLMGLDDVPPPPEPAAEKRRKLLGALERCDEDLQALRKIIEALRASDGRRAVPPSPAAAKGADGGDQPSPVSVLDALSDSPPARPRSHAPAAARGHQRGHAAPTIRSKQPLLQFPTPPSQPGQHGEHPSFHPWSSKIEALPRVAGRRAEGPLDDPGTRQKVATVSHHPRRAPCSRAMAKSVEEVWEDGVWEERWEAGRVWAALEVGILADLVAEMVGELGFRRCKLPLDACRKRLCF